MGRATPEWVDLIKAVQNENAENAEERTCASATGTRARRDCLDAAWRDLQGQVKAAMEAAGYQQEPPFGAGPHTPVPAPGPDRRSPAEDGVVPVLGFDRPSGKVMRHYHNLDARSNCPSPYPLPQETQQL